MVISLREMAIMSTLCGLPRSFTRIASGSSAGLWHAAASAARKGACLHFGDVDVEEADRSVRTSSALANAFQVTQLEDAVTLKASMQRSACQMRTSRLEGIEAVIER